MADFLRFLVLDFREVFFAPDLRFFDAFFFLVEDFFFVAFFFFAVFFAAIRLTPFFDRDRSRGQVTLL